MDWTGINEREYDDIHPSVSWASTAQSSTSRGSRAPASRSADQVVQVCRAIVSALEHPREHQLVQLNLMPSAILIDAEGAPRLADFESLDRGRNVHSSVARGGFAALEELSGGEGAVEAADVYRVGAAMYAMLTGRPPFAGSWPEIKSGVLHRRPNNPQTLNPEVPRCLQDACMKCLEKLPDARHASLQALAADLESTSEATAAS
jgi:serine/threonine-protein kinase